ncbi:MAG TPA: hypothetical protein VJ650_15805 [Gemmatimonadaceae bacterium]|nr:hypothetical protein [Gemmatimonadaceae bacterium]
MFILSIVALAAMVVVVEEEGSPRSDAPLAVPRSRAVVIDGTLDQAEWRGSAVVKRPGGEVLLRHDGKFLYIGVRTVRRGFPSVCVMRGNTVRVMHASFALGDAVYAKQDAMWKLGAPFEWQPLTRTFRGDRDLQRARFLAERGWLGSTVAMGNPRHAEMQIALDQLDARDLRISIAVLLEDEGRGEQIASWSRSGARAVRDGCANDRLVRGEAPEKLVFLKSGWTRVRLG